MHVERWAFDVECLYLAERQNIPMVEVPVTWQEVTINYTKGNKN